VMTDNRGVTIQADHSPELTLVIVIIALFATIAANTVVNMEQDRSYKWWYGLLKIVFYFGSFALAITTGGWSAGIASVSTYLGIEINKLAQRIHLNGFLSRIVNGNGANKQNKADTDTPSR
jgi:hypothetical protein